MAKPVKIFLFVVTGVLYTILFAELFLRILSPQALIPRYVTASPYGVRMNIPKAEYRQVTPETRVAIRINDQGIRAEQNYTEEKPYGVSRVALFGDSYFMGYEADLPDTFAWQLEQKLRSRRCPVEVINFAVSGFGTAEMLRTLEKKGLTFSPDIVIFQWHHTDPADNLRANLYQLTNENLVPTGSDYVPAVGTRQLLNKIPFYKTISENSHLYAATRERTSRFIKNALTGGALVLEAQPGQRPTRDMLDQPDRPDANPLDIALLQKASRVSKEAGAEFFVVDIPSFHDRTSFSSSFRLLPETLISSPSYISPIAAFRTAANPDIKLYWEQGHFHLTPEGNTILAEVVASEIFEQVSARLKCH